MAPVVIVDPSSSWPDEFRAIAAALAQALEPTANRIDHVGSTSVPALPAKDVIDIQVTFADSATLQQGCAALATAGYPVSPESFDHPVPGEDQDLAAWAKGFATQRPGERRANIHLRVEGAANQRYPLVFRDYLRSHPETAAAYASYKMRAARLLPDDVETYADLKDPVCDLIYLPAKAWAQSTGWQGPGEVG
jgi:GrpB-like predicted nucleotidyltransferase (UPF0157 family)